MKDLHLLLYLLFASTRTKSHTALQLHQVRKLLNELLQPMPMEHHRELRVFAFTFAHQHRSLSIFGVTHALTFLKSHGAARLGHIHGGTRQFARSRLAAKESRNV